MGKIMSKVAVGIVAAALNLLASNTAQAADCNSNSCSGTVKLLYTNPSNNTLYVQPEGTTTALQCTAPSSKYVTMTLDTDMKRATWQLLLAAFLAGKSVFMKLSTSGTCEIQYVTLGA